MHHPGGSSGSGGGGGGGGGAGAGGGGAAMIPVPAPSMDEKQVKRAELVESPTTRLAFKDFYRAFRAKEKTSFHAAKVFAMECFKMLPVKVHWRLYLEIADLARRENRFVEARKLYRKVTKMQPFASQGWVEYCKLEEEFGDLSRCSQILRRGLTFCEYSETLLIKAVKQEERAGNLDGARELLSRLKHVGIENVWRTVLEGALLEARSGNTDVARKVLKYLMTHVPWYGPIYYEAFRLEEKAEHFESALAIVQRGLQEIPRYGPLWFGAFRLSEKLDMRDAKKALVEGKSPFEAYQQRATSDASRRGQMVVCSRAKETVEKAKDCISKELVWKVHFEAAQIEERLASVCAKEIATRSLQAAAAAAAAGAKRAPPAAANAATGGGATAAAPPAAAKSSGPANVPLTPMTPRELREKLRQPSSPSPAAGRVDLPATSSAAATADPAAVPVAAAAAAATGGGGGVGVGEAETSIDLVRSEALPSSSAGQVAAAAAAAAAAGSKGLGDSGAEAGGVAVADVDGGGGGGGGGGGIVSEAQARNSLLGPCRSAYAHAVLTCPHNLRWKVWLAGARMELAAGNCLHAQRLLNRAFQEVPEKSKSHVFLECARLEEFTGNLECARQILERARVETKSEWKVFLESVLLEIRANDWQRAATEAQEALKVHSGAGRLWAVLVQLKQRDSDQAQQASLKQALKEVPKSGEVWCEGARIHLNPLSKAFDLETAGKYLGFAVQFTPQYGDSFMECLRLGLLNDIFLPKARAIADAREKKKKAAAEPATTTTATAAAAAAAAPLLLPSEAASPGRVEREGVEGMTTPVKEAPREAVKHAGGGDGDSGGPADGTRAARPEGDDVVDAVAATAVAVAAVDGKQEGGGGGGGGGGGDEVTGGGGDEPSPGRVPGGRFELGEDEVAAAGRLSPGDFLRAEVEGLVLRCVNADPNYGSMWFHCRHRPSDTAKSILMMSKVMMAEELTNLQDVYLHAVTRHVLLQREADAYLASRKPLEEETEGEGEGESARRRRRPRRHHGGGVGGGRSSRRRGRREGRAERRARLLEVAGRLAPPVGFGEEGGGGLKNIRGRNRPEVTIESPSVLGLLPFYPAAGAEDFVTGLASLNRITAQMGRLRSEDRRKILFGSDQIVP
ncbi:conserved unknown protein [Ectocarpus siliculosus]|uniref:Suppressor of forked domain-containing protein n=1 Tax=Ectocarpus siliculosus TaxID=2880 RepID=D8LN71_ECTSI|nr:conserved unknown protein [Ectocarpus siliculosus]|eukprot:CBN74834.1 conserved unknown protein [Ectocarpus siliculosus]